MVSTATRPPISRPDLPRASSAMSAFFFCGMIDEPVANASSSSTQPNSLRRPEHHLLAEAGQVHADQRGDEQELGDEVPVGDRVHRVRRTRRVKPSSLATATGSSGSDEPASAPAPSGDDRGPVVPVAQPVQVAQQRLDVRQQPVPEGDRLGVLHVGHAGRRRVHVPSGLLGQRVGQLDQPARPPRGRGRAGRAAGRWRPGRCGTGRRAACRRARRAVPAGRAPARCARPRRRPWAGTRRTRRRPPGRPARRASGPVRPGRAGPRAASTRACAREPARSYGASRQSNWTLTDSRASASAGPPANRPPHRLVRLVPALFSVRLLSSTPAIVNVTAASHPTGRPGPAASRRRQAPELHEALGQRLVEGVAGVVGGHAEVVEAGLGAPAGDHRAAAVQGQPHLAGDVLLGVVDERVQRAACSGENQRPS